MSIEEMNIKDNKDDNDNKNDIDTAIDVNYDINNNNNNINNDINDNTVTTRSNNYSVRPLISIQYPRGFAGYRGKNDGSSPRHVSCNGIDAYA